SAMARAPSHTADQIEAYHRDGYLHLPGFFSLEEVAPACDAITRDPSIGGRLEHVHDGAQETKEDHRNGYRLDYIGWFREGDDWLGTCTRLQSIVEGAAALIGEPVYHYHSKLARKPNVDSGSLIWHQDYGGWYQDGCVRPDMLTCVIALSDATEESGCLRFLKGSHKAGRIDRVADEHAYGNINPHRLAGIQERFEDVPAVMARGDGLFFHGNLVHASGPNVANYDRWLLELSYNGMSNGPVFDNQSHHAPVPLNMAPDDALRTGAFDGIFEHTPIQDLSDRGAEGASIYYRDGFPPLS
ncbi:MAG: phytanoyl-CoA dioxygenase family protein, partial [Alphaproteobacteria bacterium]